MVVFVVEVVVVHIRIRQYRTRIVRCRSGCRCHGVVCVYVVVGWVCEVLSMLAVVFRIS